VNIGRWAFAAVGFFAVILAARSDSQAIQLQRAQASMYIQVNVTPGPYGYAPNHRIAVGGGSQPRIVAQVMPSAQAAIPVQATVVVPSSGPQLVLSASSVLIAAQAGGASVVASCVFTVTVNEAAATHWSLDTGLWTDFSSSFPGNSLAWNMYVTTPILPETWTPFTVYPDNNNNWSLAVTNTGTVTYCVDLRLTIPVSVLSGSYGSNAVYSVYY